MKRFFLSLLALIIVNLSTWAYSFKVDGIAYNILLGTKVEVGQGGDYDNTDNPDIVIPAKVVYNGVEYSVIRIGDYAFSGSRHYLKSVVIPEGVISIGHDAFYDCYKMESVTLPSTLTSIDYRAFMYNFNLNNIIIPSGVTEIKEYTFFGLRDKLTNIKLPEGLTTIGNSAFGQCNQLVKIQIPESVTYIGEVVFSDCYNLSDVNIPSGIRHIGGNIFVGCPNIITTLEGGIRYYGATILEVEDKTLSTYTIREGTKYVGNTFKDCVNLESITIPSSVLPIVDWDAFQNCKKLPVEDGLRYADTYLVGVVDTKETYNIKDGTKYILNACFSHNLSLTSLTIPDGVSFIGEGAFYNCTSLRSLEMPNSVTTIGQIAFSGCSSLTSLKLSDNITSIESGTFQGCSSLTSLEIPGTVTSIGNSAFSDCSSLTALKIPDGINSIESNTFSGCSSLTSLEIPGTVTSIGDSAFSDCSSLTSLEMPEGITVIESGTFSNCISLRSLVIPKSVTSIGDGVFSNCKSLTLLEIPNSVTTIGFGTFSGCKSLTSIIIPDGVKRIESNTFFDCSLLTSLEIPNSVITIGQSAFYGCSSLTSLIISDGITSIESYAFSDCASLTSLEIPKSVTSIGQGAFSRCSSLTSLIISDGITSIESYAFSDCASLTSFEIPNSVTSIGQYAFSGCSSLLSIMIPASVTSIGEKAFYNCAALKTVELNEGLKSIDVGTFYGCVSLKSITIPSTINTMKYNQYAPVFGNCISLNEVIINSPIIADNFYHYFRDGYLETENGQYDMSTGGKYYLRNNRFVKPTVVIFPEGTTTIANQSFIEISDLKSFVIPSTVTSIGDNAFEQCSSLESVNIPEGVTNIGGAAFYKCSSLKSIDIPESVTTIGHSAFKECSSITNLIIPDGVKNIREWTFQSTSSLTSLSIPNTLTINDKGFYGMGNDFKYLTIRGDEMADYEIYKKIDKINDVLIFVDYGLYSEYANDPDWSNLSKKIISVDMLEPKTVQLTAKEDHSALFSELGNSSVYVANLTIKGTINGYDIMALRNKTIHLINLDLSEADLVPNDGGYEYYSGCSINNENELGNHSFAGLLLREVVLPKSLKALGQDAFKGCEYLEKVVIQDGVESVGYGCFANCRMLKDVNLPNSLTTIDAYAFQNCLLGPTLIIPDQVSTIKNHSFEKCVGLDTLVIGKNVSYIEYDAFRDCEKLSQIQFNRKLIRLGDRAFYNCQKLVDVALPYTVEQIDNNVFENCIGLQSMKIPSMAKKIGDKAFYGCNNIKNVYTYTVEPTSINQNTFSCFTTAMLNVPKASAFLYIYDTKWSQFLFVQEFDEPYDAFYLNGDVELNDSTGRLGGEPDAEMYATSGFVIEGDLTQTLANIELSHNGTNGASIIGSSGDVTGNQINLTAKSLKVNIGIDANRWYFFCFPFDVEQDSVECTTDYVFYAYDGDKRASQGSGWTKLDTDFGILNKGEGYIFQASRTGILTIHVGNSYLDFRANDEKEQLSTYTSQDASNAHWNFIGNPYISYYDVQDLAKEYNAPIVIWNGNGYDAYKPGDDDYQLHPFQAFFVQKETGSSYVEFLPENRITYNQAETRSSQYAARRARIGTPMDLDRQLVNIVLMGEDSITDRTRIVYSVNASMDYEIGVDAAKFQADGVPQIYTLNGKTKYAINERPMGTDEIKLGYTAPTAGTYTLSLPRHDAEVEIYDNVAKCKVDFTFGDYTFQTQSGTYNDRFVVYKTGGGVTKVENGFRLDGMTVKTVDGGIDIEGRIAGKVSIYNEAGMLLAEPRQAGRVELGDGVYIVKVGDKSIKMSAN